MAIWIKTVLVAVAFINMAPMVGAGSKSQLHRLYNIDIVSNDLQILMQHRAVMLGLLGGLLLVSVWTPALRLAAGYACMISMLSFILIARLVGGYSHAIGKVALVDMVAAVALAAALVGLHLEQTRLG